jgi:hypothetical protein
LYAGAPLPQVPDVQPLNADLASGIAGDYQVSRTETGSVEKGSRFVVRADGGALAVEAPTWRDFSRLYGGAAADLDRLEGQSRTVEECVAALLRGDYGPMHTAYSARLPLEDLRQRGEARLRDDETRYGKLRQHKTLGTLISTDGSTTFVRFEHERGTHYRRYVWSAEGKLRGMSASRRDAPPRFYAVPSGRFESFEVGIPSSRFAFGPSKSGGLTMEFGPDAAYEAINPAGRGIKPPKP